MSQTHDSGAAGNAFGRRTAPQIAAAIGATMIRKGSNEAIWNGRRVVIKTARQNTLSIGVSYRMLEHLDAIVAAFQNSDGSFALFEMSSHAYRKHMAPTRSTGPSAGRVGIVTRQAIREAGKALDTVAIGSTSRLPPP